MKEKSKRILRAFGEIDDKYIEACAPSSDAGSAAVRSRKPFFIAAGSVCAAAVAGVFLARSGLLFGQMDIPVIPDSSVSAPVSSNSGSSGNAASDPADSKNFFIDYNDLPFEYDGRAAEKLNAENIERPAMGFEGAALHDISEYIGSNPWNEDLEITELPAFRYTGESPEKELDRVKSLLTGEFEGAKVKTGYKNNAVGITFPEGHKLPEGIELDTHSTEKLAEAYGYLAKKYEKILGYEDGATEIRCDYTIYNEPVLSSLIYEKSGNAFEAIMNYNFRSAYFFDDPLGGDSPGLWISSDLDVMECLGFYPVISAKKAKEELLSGDFVTTVPDDYLKNGIAEELVQHVELIYHKTVDGCQLPYYRFLVELDAFPDRSFDIKQYGFYYVPAISPEYLEVDTETAYGQR